MKSKSVNSSWEVYKSLAISIYLPSFLMSICQGAVLLAIPLYALNLGADAGIAALVFAARGLGNMAMDVPAGFATARLGDRTVMLIGVALMAASGFFASQASNAWQLALSAFLFGAAMAGWLLARLSHISDAVPDSHRGRAISTMAGLQRFGNLLGPVVTGLLAEWYGFDSVFIFIAVLAILAFLVVSTGVKTNNKSHHDESPDIVRLVPQMISRHRSIFLTAGVAVLLLTMIRAGRQLLIPLWAEHLGLDPSDIGFIVGLASAVDMSLFPLAGYIMDHRGRKVTAASCLGILSLGLCMVPLTDDFFTLLLAAALAGAGNGIGSGINMTMGTDFAPASERGEFLGVWRLLSDAGSFTGPLFMGWIVQTFLLSSAFFATAVLGFVGVLITMSLVKETLNNNDN